MLTCTIFEFTAKKMIIPFVAHSEHYHGEDGSGCSSQQLNVHAMRAVHLVRLDSWRKGRRWQRLWRCWTDEAAYLKEPVDLLCGGRVRLLPHRFRPVPEPVPGVCSWRGRSKVSADKFMEGRRSRNGKGTVESSCIWGRLLVASPP